MQPVTPETLPETIRAIRNAYEEAKAEYGGIDDGGRMFLYGMRYVMCILGMPEGQSLNGDLRGVRE